MRQHYLVHLSSAAVALTLAACSDQSQLSAPDQPADLARVSPSALSMRGAVFVDVDEALNRITVGAERGAVGQVRAALARLGLPAGAGGVPEGGPVPFAGAPR